MTGNPLIDALPPQTDYLTYLTILEFNLKEDQLSTLHDLLQDTKLTINIGWDLVHLLLPLLPASRECLLDLARLGNPREVVLKVAELLQDIIPDEDDDLGDDELNAAETSKQELKFESLLMMLSILQPRIKTQYPSRFLSTTLQAILPAFARLAISSSAAEALLDFIKSVSGTKRPKLPPRKSSNLQMAGHKPPASAPDPEAQDEPVGPEEKALQTRLLQSFLTHVIEDYASSLPPVKDQDVPGLAWSARLHEKQHPEKKIAGRKPLGSLYLENNELHLRDTIIDRMVALARDLHLGSDELLTAITTREVDRTDEDEDLPTSAEDVPLSTVGSFYLLAAMHASSSLFGVSSSLPELRTFSEHSNIVVALLGEESTSTRTLTESFVDAILFTGVIAFDEGIGQPKSGDHFNQYLQRLSELSATSPSPVLRYNAHSLASCVLAAHPSDHVRLAYIRDTLEHCPFPNLKVSAIGWLKDGILAAISHDLPEAKRDENIFASPAILQALGKNLYPDLTTTKVTMEELLEQAPFFLAVLNLSYLLCVSVDISRKLQVEKYFAKSRVGETYFGPLLDISATPADRLASSGTAEVQADIKDGAIRSEMIADLELLREASSRALTAANDIHEAEGALHHQSETFTQCRQSNGLGNGIGARI
ncbi:hypothetical protein MMC09_007091 [Bachmanniomyces sp. S44760]|nr:hypothetical protein [Bachmanniomyces sp. S44760]